MTNFIKTVINESFLFRELTMFDDNLNYLINIFGHFIMILNSFFFLQIYL